MPQRRLTASDRSSLIKLASELPKGSKERRAILAGIKTAGARIREFTRGDYDGFAGAEGWDDHEPMIAEVSSASSR